MIVKKEKSIPYGGYKKQKAQAPFLIGTWTAFRLELIQHLF